MTLYQKDQNPCFRRQTKPPPTRANSCQIDGYSAVVAGLGQTESDSRKHRLSWAGKVNRLIAEDANTRQLKKIDNRGGRENASKMRLRVHFALQLCGVKETTNHNCRRFYIVVSIF